MSLGFDFFVNCAHDGWSQVDLLLQAAQAWKDNQKTGTILSIGSRSASDFKLRPNPIPYDHQKVALRSAHEALSVDSPFRCVLLELGYVENCSTIPKDLPFLEFKDLERVYDLIFDSDPGFQVRHLLVERRRTHRD